MTSAIPLANQDDESKPFIGSNYRQEALASSDAHLDTKLGRVDAVFWSSAIFSRKAMTLNHVSPHKFGDRMALGIYRMVATFLMLVLFVFLTIYESAVNNKRVYFTFAWWVSLGTLLFFALSLISFKAYFSEKPPTAANIQDGAHPFYLWKVTTFFYSFMMQAGLHLAILILLDTRVYAKVELLTQVTPYFLLVGDWLLNRLYLPAGVMLWYPLMSLLLYTAHTLVFLSNNATLLPVRELEIFSVEPMWVAFTLPAIVLASSYVLTFVKFGLMREGDLNNDTIWSAVSSVSQTFENVMPGAGHEERNSERNDGLPMPAIQEDGCESSAGTEIDFNSPSESEIRDE